MNKYDHAEKVKKTNILTKLLNFRRNQGLTVSTYLVFDAREDGDDDLA